MAKRSGMGMGLYIGGVAVSNDIGSIPQINSPRGVIDVTGIDKLAFERLLTHKDGNVNVAAHWNPALEHTLFRTLPRTDTMCTLHLGDTIGAPAASLVAKQLNYDGTRNQDGSFPFAVNLQANGYGLEWGEMHTAGIDTDTTGTNGSSLDSGAATTNFGLQAYLHVFAFTGTSVTVKIQGSSDNGAGDAFADITGATFAAANGVGWQRIETGRTQAVERYTRVVTTGTFTNAQFAVMIVRNQVATVF
jgi:hypothetical protein